MNTLLTVDEGGAPYWHRIGEHIEKMGLIDAEAFNDSYTRWRVARDQEDRDREVTLNDRLSSILPTISARSVADLVAVYIDDYTKRTRLTPGVEEMLQAWHGKASMAVVSNFFVPGLPQCLLERHGLLTYFDFVIDSATQKIRKPNPEIFLAALRRAGISRGDAHEVTMVGDDPSADIAGARAVGMKAILFSPWNDQTTSVPTLDSWNKFRP